MLPNTGYLALSPEVMASGRVNSLDGAFDPKGFFCFIGTNHRDYEAFLGLSRKGTGPMSDGLVMCRNAYVEGAPRAYAHRAHSGHFGIVNSEEGYQNLKSFLFGKVRVDGFLSIEDVRLPPEVEADRVDGKEIRASYHIEVIARVRNARWDMHRRTVDENSAIFLTYDKIVEREKKQKPIKLISTFLEEVALKPGKPLGFSIDLRVLVPEYEVDGFFFDKHHDGGYLFRDKINLEVSVGDGEVTLMYGFDSETPNQTPNKVKNDQSTMVEEGQYEFRIPVRQDTRPGLIGTLILRSRPWA